MDTETTTASPDATTATTAATSVATPSSESPGNTTQPSAEAVTATPSTGAQAASTAPSQPINRSAQTQHTTQPAGAGVAPQAPDTTDYKKRWEDTQSYVGRLQREHADLRKYREQWGDLDPNQVRQWYARQQQEAQARQLKPWHPQHPDSARTEARLSTVQSFVATRDAIKAQPNLDPETKQALIADLAQRNGITQEDATLYREHEQHVKEWQARMARDPYTALSDVVQQHVSQALAQYDAQRQASMAADQWMTDPQKKVLLEKHADDVLWAMDASTPRRDVGLTIAQLKAENEALRAKIGGNREVVETAAAQQAALKKRSTVVRDAVSSPSIDDPVESGKKQGLQGAALLAHLRASRGAGE